MVERTGGHALAEMVRRHGPGPVFGMGGFQLLPFYEGLRTLGVHHVLVNDERAGAFAADAYARVSGRVGLCDATLGPGATNLVTALVESSNAGIPLVAVVGDAHRGYARRNMTQETWQERLLGPAVKEYLRVEDIARIPELVRRAFAVATSGRPGPAVLAVPEDVAHAEHDFADADLWVDPRCAAVPALRSRPSRAAVAQAAELLAGAWRPVVLAGGGVHLSGAYRELAELAELLGAPVAHTLSGKGAVACTDPSSIGLFGRYDRFANEVIAQADALLVVGCKLGEIATRRYALPPPDVPMVHLDVAAEEIGRWARVAVALHGDAREGLRDLVEAIGELPQASREPYWEPLRQLWAATARPRYTSTERPVHMARLIGELNAVLPPEAVLVADGGFASHWAGLLHDTKRAGRGFVADRGFASIGYGLPAAIGASLGAPGAPVVAITGDGGFNMAAGELETARRLGLDFVLVVVNNAASGYVKALQHAVYGPGGYQSSDLLELDYAAVATAYGCRGIRVEDPAELRPALLAGLAETGRPTVLDVVVTRDPARMLPAADSRALTVRPGDRPA
ncbi:thiamine pyrophosphate-binding protein [Pseudonocardia humida]|uniref:Thiamine pyrophosphate-binding protein n=1 Tax=Pseudonocardia humida TaxID=2800819 RepID=A0ABT1A6R0_9PSEU|nr:thiamine pyrophosphate-binding protein [Pseudonocardia humida]MCO1658514.1 thiamine pyrophosphate-binding protein [Pseudonocardia humida]